MAVYCRHFTKGTLSTSATSISVLLTVIFPCQLLTSVDWSVVCPLQAELAPGMRYCINSEGFELKASVAQSALLKGKTL